MKPQWKLLALLPLLLPLFQENGEVTIFEEPIDAVSVGVYKPEIDLELRSFAHGRWSDWVELELEIEENPEKRESNLVMLPEGTTKVSVRGSTEKYEVHPIRVSDEPVHVEVAATNLVGRPTILSRSQWGADDSYLYKAPASSASSVREESRDTTNGTISSRVQDCLDAKANYPEEFEFARVVTQNSQGQTYRWAQQYSPDIKMLVVHHTALKVTGDERSGVERMRALYAYHANNNSWGDIGYHYIVDEAGQIYEGRAGGDYVVGGQLYCGNIGTIGIALMGNFEVEQPTQRQMQSLQSLLSNLADKYGIDPSRTVKFHGKNYDPIVGHGDVISTACPGYYLRQTLSQVRRNVATGNLDGHIVFPSIETESGTSYTEQVRLQRLGSAGTTTRSRPTGPLLSAVGSTTLVGRPGADLSFTMQYRAGQVNMTNRARIATVERSSARVGLWQQLDGRDIRMRDELILPEPVAAGQTITLFLRLQFPREGGNSTLRIGDVVYTLKAEGRRLPTGQTETSYQSFRTEDRQQQAIRVPVARTPVPTPTATTTVQTVTPSTSTNDEAIRIRLGFVGDDVALSTSSPALFNGRQARTTTAYISKSGDRCSTYVNGQTVSSDILRIDPNGWTKIANWNVNTNRFRGIIECRVINGELVLINELPLEQYIDGLAEEPDSEPYEKQRAFAIAARSYAAHYMQPENRKFPGMPYDGDDSPARFQKYGGIVFEEANPRWVKATASTRGLVVSKNNQIVKTAYFSTNDGRTRSPAENGWKSFPFPEVFASKPDPWCEGMQLWGHGVGMSGCGSEGQANEGKSAEEILSYYYPTTTIVDFASVTK